MTDEQIRAIVREELAQHRPSATEVGHPPPLSQPLQAPAWRAHPSFGRFLEQTSGTIEGMCVVEPAVHCNGCGFCQCFGY